jgi:hypothetical protein
MQTLWPAQQLSCNNPQHLTPPAICCCCCLPVCHGVLCGVQLALGSILGSGGARELPCGVFGSFGWSGEAVDEMEAKLKDGGYGFAFQPIKVKFKPTTKVSGHPRSKHACRSTSMHHSCACTGWLLSALLPRACWLQARTTACSGLLLCVWSGRPVNASVSAVLRAAAAGPVHL